MTPTVDAVKDVVVSTLGIQDRAGSLDAGSPLMDAIPELDSMAVVELLVALEDRFGISINDADVTGEVFDTLGSLASFVDEQVATTLG